MRRGFTLIELLVVIGIIGLLASIVLVSLNGARAKGSIGAGSYQEQDILQGIGGDAVLWLDFTNCAATPGYDNSGMNNQVSLINVPTCSTNVPVVGRQNSLAFNGLNSYIQVPNASYLQYTGGNMTIAFWAYPNSTESDGGNMVSKPWNGNGNYNYRITYNSDTTLSVLLSGQSGVTVNFPRAMPKSQWTYVVVTISPTVVTMYLNGALVSAQNYTAPVWTPPASGDSQTPLAIGTLYPYGNGWGGNTGFSFDGNVSDFRMYSRTFTSEDVRQQFLAEAPRFLAIADMLR